VRWRSLCLPMRFRPPLRPRPRDFQCHGPVHRGGHARLAQRVDDATRPRDGGESQISRHGVRVGDKPLRVVHRRHDAVLREGSDSCCSSTASLRWAARQQSWPGGLRLGWPLDDLQSHVFRTVARTCQTLVCRDRMADSAARRGMAAKALPISYRPTSCRPGETIWDTSYFYRRQRHWENDAYPRRLHGTAVWNSTRLLPVTLTVVLVLTKFTQGLPVARWVTRPRFSPSAARRLPNIHAEFSPRSTTGLVRNLPLFTMSSACSSSTR